MGLRPVLILALSLAIALPSAALKVASLERSAVEPGAVVRRVAAFLAGEGLAIEEIELDADPPTVRAASGECRLRVIEASPHGWHRSLVRVTTGRDRSFFVYDGRVLDEQPVWETWSYFQWRRMNNLVARRLPEMPVLAVTQSPACEARGLAWTRLFGAAA